MCRLKAAGLPARHDLDRYDFTRTEGIDSRKLRELRELVWVGQAYNLLLAGGSGTGKTYIAAGLVHEPHSSQMCDTLIFAKGFCSNSFRRASANACLVAFEYGITDSSLFLFSYPYLHYCTTLFLFCYPFISLIWNLYI